MLTDTKRFLKHFDGHHIFVAMPEFDHVPWHLHNGYDKSLKTMNEKNEEGWGIFFTVNELDESLDPGKHRTMKMVVRCRASFMDDDHPRDNPRDDFPLKPSLIVQSSPGKYHYYWLIKDGTEELQEWKQVQNSIINKYDGDNQAKDMTRYLRLPGFKHWKDKNNPFVSTWEIGVNEGDILYYEWSEIVDSFGKSDVNVSNRRSDSSSSTSADSDSQSIAEVIGTITSGGEGLHGAINKYATMQIKDGIAPAVVKETLKGLMMACPEKDERWQSRYNEIDRSVDGAVEQEEQAGLAADDLPSFNDKPIKEGEMPWPPGLLGKLAQAAYDMQIYQYREVAIVSALGLVAGICGRKFNINGAGLNVYLTLIMRTGMGKDSIPSFINGTLMNLNEIGTASSFCGPVRFTGPKAVIRSLQSARSQVCVFTEAGLLLKSRAGDREGLTRVLLSMYGSSGSNKYSGAEFFSKDEDTVSMLRAPALTIVNEATPSTLLDAFRDGDALERGDLPRQSIYRISDEKPYININHKTGIEDKQIWERLKELLKVCASVQAVEDPQAWPMIPEQSIVDDMHSLSRYYVDYENEHRHDNSVHSIMSSRAFMKVLKFAAIASVFNHKEAVIKKTEWEWAKSMVEYEMRGLDNFFTGGVGEELADIAQNVVGKAIIKILKGEYKSPKQQATTLERKKGHVPLSALRQAVRRNADLNKLNDDTKTRSKPITGLEKVLDYMKRAGLIRDVKSLNKPAIMITEAFKQLYS